MKKKKLIVIIIAFLIIILTALIIILNVFSSKKNSDELVEESLKIREEETKEMIKDYLSDKICPQRMATLYAEYEGKNDLNDLYRGLYNFVGYISEMYPTLKKKKKKELEEYFKENSVKIRKTFGADSVEEFSKFISYLKKIGFSEKYTYKYYQHLNNYDRQDDIAKLTNPVVYIHREHGVPAGRMPISYNLLLNLASAANTERVSDMWGYITAYNPELNPQNSPELNKMAESAVNYYHDFVKPNKKYRDATDQEKEVLKDLMDGLAQFVGKSGIEKDLETYC